MSADDYIGATDWHTANQLELTAELARVRGWLERYAATLDSSDSTSTAVDVETTATVSANSASQQPEPSPPNETETPADVDQSAWRAIDQLSAIFGLTSFERDLLLLCAGTELDFRFGPLCAAAQGDPHQIHPTFSLALSALPDPHWSALRPTGPLRYWRLIEVEPGSRLTTSSLRIDERTLHFLTGVRCLDERLLGLVRPLTATAELAPSQSDIAERLVHCWEQSSNTLVQLCGDDPAGAYAVAASACAVLDCQLFALTTGDLPQSAVEREAFARLWEREALFSNAVLLVECEESSGTETSRPATSFLQAVQGRVIVISREPLRLLHRDLRRFEVNRPSESEQRAFWRKVLGPAAQELNGQVESTAAQFDLGLQAINAASREALEQLSIRCEQELGSLLWDACRAQSRPRLDDLAQRIVPKATWNDLVLPTNQLEALHHIAAHVRQRTRVYEEWGFVEKSARGLGISALFSGASGTGKTMAAEVLANELKLDLYRIDLSVMVSKYIGETEKNLRRVFDAAEEGGVILLFDEADALFGKRSEVKDSHDRYANIEVSYLLQRMEAYRGLAILTTNMKSAVDQAFMRRLRFVIHFPFPDAAQRTEIWQRIFPEQTPTYGLEPAKLARLNIAGGNIRNIALGAMFFAADAGERVQMNHLLAAVRNEYAKLEKLLTETEIGGWV